MRARLPHWFKKAFLPSPEELHLDRMLEKQRLFTICRSALCPNRRECFSQNTATFLILGEVCTRNCTFCAVPKGRPAAPDGDEPRRLAEAVRIMGLGHAVITSVSRDDLPDGGAAHFVQVIEAIRKYCPGVTVEVLIPDFRGSREALKAVALAEPEVINHNLETVPRLYPQVRPMAVYERSLSLLSTIKALAPGILTKSGFMVGLGETRKELSQAMKEVRAAGCDFLTVGQYLQPTSQHHPTVRFLLPEEFEEIVEEGKAIGFRETAAAPLVRSSYQAARFLKQVLKESTPSAPSILADDRILTVPPKTPLLGEKEAFRR